MFSLLFLVLALFVVVGEAVNVVFDNYDPDDLPHCAARDFCDEITCEGASNATTAELVGSYRYVTDGAEWMQFHQDLLCACNRVLENVTYWADGRPLRIVADSLCRIPQSSGSFHSVLTPTPSCRDLGVGEETEITGCHEYCNEVVFADVLEELCDKSLPWSQLGVGSSHPVGSSLSIIGYDCECRYGNATLRVCRDPPISEDDSGDAPVAPDDGTDSEDDSRDAPVAPDDGTDSEDDFKSGACAGNRFWLAAAVAIAAAAEIVGF